MDVQKGSDLTGDGSISRPFKTLTRGLAAAKAGDLVKAAPGIYDRHRGEKFPLVLPAGVSLEGAGTRDVFLIGGNAWGPTLSVILQGGTAGTVRVSSLSILGGWFALEAGCGNGSGPCRLHLERVALEGAGGGVKVRALPSGWTLSLTLDHCIVKENWGVGLLLDSGKGSLEFRVRGTVLMGNGYDGILAWAGGQGASLKGSVLQSTLAGNGGAGLRVRAFQAATPTLKVTNSILWGNRSGDLVGVPAASVDHCLLGAGAAAGKRGNIKGDPRFLNPGDFHLGLHSQAARLGDPQAAGLPATDLDGQALPAGRAPDAGADQLVLHTLVGDPSGLRLSRHFRMEIFTLPRAVMVVFLSSGTVARGFPTPPLTGALKLDFIAALVPFGNVVADGEGKGVLKGTMFTTSNLLGVRLYFQGVALRVEGGRVEGGWTNVISPSAIEP